MTVLRLRVVVQTVPTLRIDGVGPVRHYRRQVNGICHVADFLVFVDVACGMVRIALGTLNHCVRDVGVEGACAHCTPARSVATSPMAQQVTSLIEFPVKGPVRWDIIETLWARLYHATNFDMQKFRARADFILQTDYHGALLIFQSYALAYTTSRST